MISAAPAEAADRENGPDPESGFKRPWLLLLIAAFVVIAFPTVIIGKDSFFYRDMGQFGYPLAQFHREAFWRGEIPLWNPHNNCGLPFLAQWNTLVLYPGSLMYLLLPLPAGMNVFVLAHLFLAAAGMYSLALRWTNNRFAACLAGLAFAWNGLTLHALMWPNNIAALGWMPWLVLASERAWTEGSRRIAIAALIGAMQMLAGAPEIILLTWIVIALFWCRELLKAGTPRGKLIFRLVAVGLLVALICAPQLLPFWDLLRHSNRDTSFGGTAWAMPLWGVANFFVPLFGCSPSVIGVYSQDVQQWTSSYYMGIGIVLFAFMAGRAHDSRVKWLAGIALGGLLLSLGEDGYVYTGLKKVLPVFGFIRFPIKCVVLVVFAFPLLAAFGVASLRRDAPGKRKSSVRLLCSAGITLGLIALCAAVAAVKPMENVSFSTVAQSAVTRAILLLLVLVTVIWRFRSEVVQQQRIALVLVLLLAALDVLTHTPRQNPVVPNHAYGALEMDMNPAPEIGRTRAMISPPMQALLASLAHADPSTMFRGYRRMLLSDCNLIDHVPKVNGFFSLYLREADEITRRLYRTTNYAELPLLDFLGVSQLSSANELFVWHTRTNALPLVTVGQAPRFASAQETFDALFKTDFDPRRIVYLPNDARGQATGIQANGARVVSSNVQNEKVSAEVETSGASVVVLAQAHCRPWKAFVDGRAAPILKANHAFQAVIVPSGRHRLELRYEDPLLRYGGILSALTALGCVAFVFRTRMRRTGIARAGH
jgi:hypothetical protein